MSCEKDQNSHWDNFIDFISSYITVIAVGALTGVVAYYAWDVFKLEELFHLKVTLQQSVGIFILISCLKRG